MAERKPEWQVIVDLLRATDSRELSRISRKLLNYLLRRDVQEASDLLEKFHVAYMSGREEDNRPSARANLRETQSIFDETFAIAEKNLSEDVLSEKLMEWVSEGRTRFLTLAAENQGVSLTEITEKLNRFCKLPQSERVMSEAEDMGIRVSLIRRFMTGSPKFINVSKKFIKIEDISNLLNYAIGPAYGHGKLGGKGAGLFLAKRIIEEAQSKYRVLQNVRVPKTWFLLSDAILDFLHYNALEEVINIKYRRIEEIRTEYKYFEQVFKQSQFSSEILQGFSLALDDLEGKPIIVRSSSLLEDSFGAAFSGKYKSLFIANRGTKHERMEYLMDAVAEVMASTFSPDAIQYRIEHDLLDFQEQMGCLIQEVVGVEIGGRYYAPTIAGVAFTNNEFRWSPRIKRKDGVVRLVTGLGTRAVDRVGNDYPMLISPGQPNLRVNMEPSEIVKYSQKYIDVVDLHDLDFKTLEIKEMLQKFGDEFPGLTKLVDVYENGNLTPPNVMSYDPKKSELVFTFEQLLKRTPFVEQIKILLELLSEKYQSPVDIEFASNGLHLYILQCRPQAQSADRRKIKIPDDVAIEDKIFGANKFVSDGYIPNVGYICYVDPVEYDAIESLEKMGDVGRVVSAINQALPKKSFILMGPGRWGSRGDIKLGVKVTYSDISKTAMLVEIAKSKGGYVPEVSFGTHFFQDLVESDIKYLPVYPDENKSVFNEEFLQSTHNCLLDVVPWAEGFTSIVKLINVERVTEGKSLFVVMDGDSNKALAYLAAKTDEQPEEHWREHENISL